MKIGSLVFTTDQGLSYLAKDFYDNGVITDVMVIRHGRRKEHSDWYPGAPVIGNMKSQYADMMRFVESMDVMLYFETPFVWDLLRLRPSALMVMHECMPDPLTVQPTAIFCPSLLDLQCYKGGSTPATFIPVPVNVPWKQRHRARVFVHNAGNGGLNGRNGTKEFVEAIKLVRSPAQFVLRMQEHQNIGNLSSLGVRVIQGTQPSESLYDGDVFVFPEKFNGLSLPLQEAYASGMLVMATDRFPNDTYLPIAPLLPTSGSKRARVAGRCREFDEAIISPKTIAELIDLWYDMDISEFNELGREWAKTMSWVQLRPRYMEELRRLVISW